MLKPSKAARSAPHVTISATKKRQRMLVAGDSLLRGMEAPICRPDAFSREMCSLPGAHIEDVTKRLPSLVQSTGCYPLLLFHMHTNDTARSSLNKDCRALGAAVRDSVAQFFHQSSRSKGRDLKRASRIWQNNKWLQDWSHSRGFGCLDCGNSFEKPGLLEADGVHLTEKGKSIFSQKVAKKLAKLVKVALN